MTTTKYKAYSEYKPSGVEWLGDVPGHWRLDRQKWTVLGCINGIWGSEPEGTGEDIACIRVADFDRVTFRTKTESPTLRAVPVSERNGRVLSKGDLLLEKSGGGELQPVGAVVIYDQDIPAVCSNFVAHISVRKDFDPRFLTYCHAFLYYARVNTRSIKQTTGIQNLDVSAYLNELIGIPPLPEQRAIAAFLDRETTRIDGLIAKKQRQIELLQEKRAALISHAVTKGLNPNAKMKDSGIEWLGEIPEHWEVKRLKHSVILVNQKVDGENCNLPYTGLEHIESWTGKRIASDGQISSEGQANLYRHGDVLFGKLRPYLAKVLAVYENGICTGELLVLRPVYVLQQFLLGYLLNPDVISIIDSSTYGVKMPRANWDFIGNLPMLIPPLPEQRAIAAFLDRETARIDGLINKVNESIALLREYRTALISAAVTGKIDVRKETA